MALTVCRSSHNIQEELIHLQRFQWLHEKKGRSWESQPGIQVEETYWPFKSGQCCVPRVFNGDRKRLRKTPLYMLFSIALQ